MVQSGTNERERRWFTIGLDIYLQKAANPQAAHELKTLGNGPDADYSLLYNDVEVPRSKVDPDHLWKLDYIRSSYNAGGFNTVMRAAGLGDLYWIFGEPDGFHTFPDWADALDRARLVRKAYEGAAPYRAMAVSHNPFRDGGKLYGPQREHEAITIAEAMLEKWGDRNDELGQVFGNADGSFMPSGFEIVAALPGFEEFSINGDERAATWLVYKTDDDHRKHYLTSLDILIESIEWVLARPDTELYFYLWSG